MADCARLKGRHKLTHYGHVPSNYDFGYNETQWPLFKSLVAHLGQYLEKGATLRFKRGQRGWKGASTPGPIGTFHETRTERNCRNRAMHQGPQAGGALREHLCDRSKRLS